MIEDFCDSIDDKKKDKPPFSDKGKRTKEQLIFSKTDNPNGEERYFPHYVEKGWEKNN